MALGWLPAHFNAGFAAIEHELTAPGQPNELQLGTVRDFMDDAAVLAGLKDLVSQNFGTQLALGIPNHIAYLTRLAEAKQAKTEFFRNVVLTIGGGGSAALLVGSLMALINPTIGAIGIIPAFGGIMTGFTVGVGAHRMEGQRLLYKQITDRLGAMWKALEP